MYNKYFTMKRSELKEAIKAEIKSVLSEAMSDEERKMMDDLHSAAILEDEDTIKMFKNLSEKELKDYADFTSKITDDGFGDGDSYQTQTDYFIFLRSLPNFNQDFLPSYFKKLKEAIKAEITSVLSEQSNNPDFDKKVASFAKKINNEMDYPGGVLEAMKQIKSRLERIISKVEDAKRGGAEEEPLMKMIGLKEAMFNEDAVLEDIMLAIDLHLAGKIDYNEMSKKVEDLISGKIKPDFKVMNEGTWSVGTKEQIGNFIKDMEKIKIHYNDIVGDDEVYNGLDSAISRAEEMMGAKNKSDIKEDEMSDDEMDKKASRGAKKEPIGKEAERLAQVQKFMRQMQDKGIVGKDKKILDTPKYKEEFAKFKADLKKKKLEESI